MGGSTPVPTKVMLVIVLATGVVAALFGGLAGPVDSGRAAVSLSVFTGLFAMRVAGQLLVQLRAPRWLPANELWALTPYPVLLPAQLVILGLMVWIDMDVARGQGRWATSGPGVGVVLLWFSSVYAGVMIVRYVTRMARQPDQRWFGGAIPIFLHWVLAGYLAILGTVYAAH